MHFKGSKFTTIYKYSKLFCINTLDCFIFLSVHVQCMNFKIIQVEIYIHLKNGANNVAQKNVANDKAKSTSLKVRFYLFLVITGKRVCNALLKKQVMCFIFKSLVLYLLEGKAFSLYNFACQVYLYEGW